MLMWLQVRNQEKGRKLLGPGVDLVSHQSWCYLIDQQLISFLPAGSD
jgi:hypothetical protein